MLRFSQIGGKEIKIAGNKVPCLNAVVGRHLFYVSRDVRKFELAMRRMESEQGRG